ncbi:MAG: DoxX family protein [Candidatus Nomurabacteria bacterium]|nr:DoxX family protein [Candidatus Nomurabacteria bacterium]
MNRALRISLVITRISFGWVFFWAGLSKIINPSWSAVGYLSNSSTFPKLFEWFTSASNIGWVNFVNEWGLLLIGVSLILGLFVRWASIAGIILMILYWLPLLDFPYVGHGIIIDDHIMYAFIFAILIHAKAGKYFGLEKIWNKKFSKKN